MKKDYSKEASTERSDATQNSSKRLEHSFRFVIERSGVNTAFILEQAGYLYSIVNLLVQKQIVTEEEISQWRHDIQQRHMSSWSELAPSLVLHDCKRDKYSCKEITDINCKKRINLCKAACCRMNIALSKQDLDEGIIRWDISRPYLVRRGETGYCCHYNNNENRCCVYANRPLLCRTYDCRKDSRIWLDFDEYIVNPKLDELLNKCRLAAPDVCCDDYLDH